MKINHAFQNAKGGFQSSSRIILIFLAQTGRQTILGNDLIRTELELNSSQSIDELPNIFNQSWLTIQEHLQQIGNVRRAGVWALYNLMNSNKDYLFITLTLLFQWHT